MKKITSTEPPTSPLDALASILLRTTTQEEPHHADPRLPERPVRELHPAFFGCFDWHSAVHSHWSMAKLRNSGCTDARLKVHLESVLTERHLDGEAKTLQNAPEFELPYGLAWLMLLDAELVSEPRLREHLAPLVSIARDRLLTWLDTPANETGLHRQTAFSLHLLHLAATRTGDVELARLAGATAINHWGSAKGRSLVDEAGPTDFLTPGLMAAVAVAPFVDAFDRWLSGFLPSLADEVPSIPVAAHDDPTDGHKTHLDGLNLNRAYAARVIAGALDQSDPRVVTLTEFADRHARAGLAASTTEHFAGSHWLPTFAVLLLTS